MPVVGVTHDEHGEPIRQIPRKGVIKAGLKVGNAPRATDYFVVSHLPEVVERYGDKPKSLPVQLPCPDVDLLVDVHMKAYGATGLKCKGDGKTAHAAEVVGGKVEWKPIACPCPKAESGDCKCIGTLNVYLHEISVGAVYQFHTSSATALIRMRTAIEQHVDRFGPYALFIPMVLALVPETAFPVVKGARMRLTVMRPSLACELSMTAAGKWIERLKQLNLAESAPQPVPVKALPPPPSDDGMELFFQGKAAPTQPAPLALPDTVRLPESVTRGAEELGLTPAQLQARINKHNGDLRAVGAELSAEVDRRNAGDQGRLL